MRPVYLISKTPYPGVIHIPVLSIRFLTPSIDFSHYSGIVLTSKQAIDALKGYDVEWDRLICLCVSAATAHYAEQTGAKHIEVAQGYGETIPELLRTRGSSERWLYLRPKTVATGWVETARSFGVLIDEAIVYETICNPAMTEAVIEPDGVLIFTSPSSIHCFRASHSILPTQRVVAIGKTTLSALPDGVEGVVSEEQSVASAVEKAREIACRDEISSPF